jgi:hypothetical protein
MLCMKIRNLLLAMIFCFVAAAPAAAENLAEPLNLSKGLMNASQNFGLVVGFDTDFSTDRNLKDTSDDTELMFYGAKVGAVISDRALVSLLVGQASAKTGFQDGGAALQTETEKDLYWGIGGSVILAEKKFDTGDRLAVGLDGWYRTADLGNDSTKIGGVAVTPTADEWTYNEFQLGLGISYKLEFFVPYLGVKFADVSGDHSITAAGTRYHLDLEADSNIGVFGGASFSFGDMGAIGIEARLGDEVSYGAYGLIRF